MASANLPSLLLCRLQSWATLNGTPGQELKGYDDWKNLDYNLRDWESYPYRASGLSVSSITTTVPVSEVPEEPSVAGLQWMGSVVDYDSEGFPNSLDTCPAFANPDQRIPAGADCGVSFRKIVLLPLVKR